MRLDVEFELLFRLSSDNNKWLAVVKGLPGGGKSRATLSNLINYSRAVKVVYSAPLRSLRDYWANYFGMEVIKSRDELCPAIKLVEEDNVLDYLVACAEVCSNCNGNCEFKELFKNFIRSKHGSFALTHKMLMVLYLATPDAFKNSLLVIDEADSLFEQWSIVCELDKVKYLLKYGDRIAKRVVRRLVKNCIAFGKWVFFKPVVPLARVTFLVSATLIPEFLELMPIPEDVPCRTFYVKSEFKDRLVWNCSLLKWEERESWTPKALEFIEAHLTGRVGIASRNYRLTKAIHDYFQNKYEVTSDYYHEKPKRDAKIIVWTTRGKWYRGISLPDTDVIFCFYQYPLDAPPLNPYLIKAIDERDVKYFQLLNDAVNVQSYFRSNRIRRREHIMYFMDRRGYTALNRVFPRAWVRKCKREWFRLCN